MNPSPITKRALGAALAFLLFSFPSAAQEPPPSAGEDGPAPATDKGAELVAEIKAADTKLLEIVTEIPAAEGERLTILRTEFSELASQQGRHLSALLDVIESLRQAGADVTLLEQQAQQLLNRSSRRLRRYLESFEDHLQRESAERESLEVDQLQRFEHRMALDTDRLDHLYLSLISLMDEMAAWRLPVDDERAFLEARLGRRGEELLKTLQLAKSQLETTRDLLAKKPEDEQLKARRFAREERYDSTKTSLLATIHMMRRLGIDHADLEVRTLEITGEITPEALEVEVAVGLVERALGRIKSYLVENGPGLLLRLLVIAGILAAFWLVARLARSVTRRALEKTRGPSQLLKEMAVALSGRLILLVGLVLALSQLGVELGPLLAGFGIVGLVVGFALQDSLANFAAGAMILAYRPYDVGDLVEAAGTVGKVSDMNLVSTRILTPDHQTLIVPNSKIWGDVIRNLTAQAKRRVDLVFGISYEDEIPKAERVLKEIVEAHEKVLAEPEPVIKLHALNDSSVDFVVRPWARTEDYWQVYWDLTREVKLRFDQEGISIPYPQRAVHLIGGGAGEAA